MRKSSIRFQPVKSNSEKHNTRDVIPKYVIIKENSNNLHGSDKNIKEYEKELKKIYKQKIGRKMSFTASPIKEAVINLPNGNNEENYKKILKLGEHFKNKYNIELFQIHIHNDEGHINKDNEFICNYHAHLIFNFMDKNTGKTFRPKPKELTEIQTETAEIMEMERGIIGSKNLHLNHNQYRHFAELKKEQNIKKEEELEIRKQLKYGKENKIDSRDRERNKGIER